MKERKKNTLGALVLGYYREETIFLGCWDSWKGWRSLNFTHEDCMGADLPTNRVESACITRCHTPQSKSSEHPGPLIPQHSLVLDLCHLGPRKRLAMQRWPGGLVCGPCETSEAIVSTSCGGTSRIMVTSVPWWSQSLLSPPAPPTPH